MANIVGNWTLHVNWDCSTAYDSASITLKSDGTAVFESMFYGNWVAIEGMFMLTWNMGPAKYVGTIAGNVMAGVASTMSGSPVAKGCWYATKSGVANAVAGSGNLDALGNKPASKKGTGKKK